MKMRWMRILAVAALAAVAAHAETQQEAGQRLIRECLKAVGGPSFLGMRDRMQRGRAYQFYLEQLSGLAVITIYTRYDPKPSSPEPGWLGVRERRDIGKKADYSILYTDGKGYEITYRGAQPFGEAQMRQYRERLRRDIFYILKYRMDEPGMIFESLGIEIMDNQPTDSVRITDGDNNSVTVYLSQSTHLPIQQEYLRRDPKTREVFRETTKYGKYKLMAGVQLPWYSQLVRDGEKIFEMFADTVEINKGLDDSLFALKKGTKVLKGEK